MNFVQSRILSLQWYFICKFAKKKQIIDNKHTQSITKHYSVWYFHLFQSYEWYIFAFVCSRRQRWEQQLNRMAVFWGHYNDVIMTETVSQITGVWIVYPNVRSDADQRRHQSSASLAFVRGIHRWPVNSPHKGQVTRKNVAVWWRHHVLRYTYEDVKIVAKSVKTVILTFVNKAYLR